MPLPEPRSDTHTIAPADPSAPGSGSRAIAPADPSASGMVPAARFPGTQLRGRTMADYLIHRCRNSGIPLGTPAHFEWLRGIAKGLLVLNLLDGIFTLVWVEYFGAEELNILLADLVYDDALLFMLVKLTLVSLGTLFLWRNRHNFLSVISIFVAFFGYYMVLLIHLQRSSILLF